MNAEERDQLTTALTAAEEVFKKQNLQAKVNSEHWHDWYWMTLCIILTPFSLSKRGHMAALVVRDEERLDTVADQLENIVMWSNNKNLIENVHDLGQEIHAEQNIIAQAAARGICLQGTTLYVTFPPCQTCLVSLLVSGVTRVVHRRRMIIPYAARAAEAHHVKFYSTCADGPDPTLESLRKETAHQVWQKMKVIKPGCLADMDAKQLKRQLKAGELIPLLREGESKRKQSQTAEGGSKKKSRHRTPEPIVL